MANDALKQTFASEASTSNVCGQMPNSISEQTPPRQRAQLREAPEKLPKVPIEVVQLEPQISGKTLTDGPAAAFQRGSAFDGLKAKRTSVENVVCIMFAS